MTITSPVFADHQLIPSRYTCDGDNVSPPLALTQVPAGAQSLALIMDDPDAPRGTWVHWTVWNILPTMNDWPEGTVPTGVMQGVTSFGKTGYDGPCPPDGEHRYFFKLYALDIQLALKEATTAAQLEAAMVGHVLAQADLVGRYVRANK